MQRFAWRQLALMESEGLSEKAARERVDAEVAAATKRAAVARASGEPGGDGSELLAPPAQRKVMAEIQAEEEAVIRAAAAAGGLRLGPPTYR